MTRAEWARYLERQARKAAAQRKEQQARAKALAATQGGKP